MEHFANETNPKMLTFPVNFAVSENLYLSPVHSGLRLRRHRNVAHWAGFNTEEYVRVPADDTLNRSWPNAARRTRCI